MWWPSTSQQAGEIDRGFGLAMCLELLYSLARELPSDVDQLKEAVVTNGLTAGGLGAGLEGLGVRISSL
jgi:hypothetical protein